MPTAWPKTRLLALIGFVALAASPARAESYKDQYREAERLFQSGQYGEALQQLELVLESKLTPEPFAVDTLELKGRILRKREDWPSAADTYAELVHRLDPHHYEQVADPAELRRRLKKGGPGAAPPERVLANYYNLGQVSEECARKSTGEERRQRMQQARQAFVLVSELGYRKSFAESALRELDEMEAVHESAPPTRKQRQARAHGFVSVGYQTWKETFAYRDTLGDQSGITFEARTPCVGGGAMLQLLHFDLGVKGCLAYGTGSVNPQKAGINYTHEGIRTYGAFVGPFLHWRPLGPGLAVGPYFPVVYRIADLPVPQTPGETLEARNNFAFAFAFEIETRLGPISLTQRIGASPSFSAPLWSLSLSYYFGPARSEANE